MLSTRGVVPIHRSFACFALLLTICAQPTCAQTLTDPLTNPHLRATFGPRGITAITDLTSRHTDHLRTDDFAITLSGTVIDSRTLPAPTIVRGEGVITYNYASGIWQVHVTYRLQADWHFVSKELSVTALAARSFRIGSVTLVRSTLVETPLSVFTPMSANEKLGTAAYGAALRSSSTRSLLMVAQNPFLHVTTRGRNVSLTNTPDMEWRAEYGTFTTDRALIAPIRLSGHRIAAAMTPEWQPLARGAPGLDDAEVAAFTGMVRAHMLYQPKAPVNIFVGWCANDYQIDVGTPAGRDEYRRIFDQAAAVGAQYVLYAPSNSAISRREESLDDWSWEHVLWLGLGQKIRRNEWDPRSSAMPPSVQEMLDAARERKLGLLAYVYPVLPFAQNPAWLVPSRRDSTRMSASLGNRALQDWLIEELVAFHTRTGIAGFAFDHTFLTYQGTSGYAQWYGSRRVMEELRRRIPDIVIDGRQAHHLYGPWSYLAGSYPHPTFHDEQPESFTPYPDLHFDRVSANRERFTAYRYRHYEFTPNELVPGFMTHQTPRLDETEDMPSTKTADRGIVIDRFRARDWDYLGWRYSVLSSIAVGGWNNVINMIPARDSAENASFSAADKSWLRGWLEWTAANTHLLNRTRHILGQSALGKIDGTTMIDADSGYIFLFNPDPRPLTARIPLDRSIGLTDGTLLTLREVHPLDGRSIGRPGAGQYRRGDTLHVALDGGSALVIRVAGVRGSVRGTVRGPMLFGATGSARIADGTLVLDDVRGNAGTVADLTVTLPSGVSVRGAEVNGAPARISARRGDVLTIPVRFGATTMRHMQPVVQWDPRFAGGRVAGTLTIPRPILEQLKARRSAWPIPWSADDLSTTWLAPERLLLWAPFSSPDARWNAQLRIDGAVVPLQKAYTAIHRKAPGTFTGFYADISALEPNRAYRIELTLPATTPGRFLGLYVENIEPEYVPATPIP